MSFKKIFRLWIYCRVSLSCVRIGMCLYHLICVNSLIMRVSYWTKMLSRTFIPIEAEAYTCSKSLVKKKTLSIYISILVIQQGLSLLWVSFSKQYVRKLFFFFLISMPISINFFFVLLFELLLLLLFSVVGNYFYWKSETAHTF